MLRKFVCYSVVTCLSLGFCTAGQADLYTDADLLAYWNFDQTPTSGTTVVDQSTTTAADQLNLAMDAQASWSATGGINGGCINFSSGGGLSASDSATAGEPIDRIDFNPTDDFTIAYWVKIPTVDDGQGGRKAAITNLVRPMQKVGTATTTGEEKGWFFVLRNPDNATDPDHLEYYLRETKTNGVRHVMDRSDEEILLDEWVHVAWTFDGNESWSGTNPTLTSTLYFNGEEVGRVTSGSWVGSPPDTTNDSTFQVWNQSLASGSDDLAMDDIAVWGRALSDVEIDELATVPEPSSLMLALFGALGLAVVTRRKTLRG